MRSDIASSLLYEGPTFVDLGLLVSARPSPEERPALEVLQTAARAGVGAALVVGAIDPEHIDAVVDADDLVAGLARVCADAPLETFYAARLLRSAGDEPADLHRAKAAGAIAAVDVPVQDPSAGSTRNTELLRCALELCRTTDLLAVLSPVDGALRAGAIATEGPTATRFGLPAAPMAAAEIIGVTRAVALARLTGARVHLHGVSTGAGAAIVAAARAEGLAVSGDVAPWSLVLDDGEWARRVYDTTLCVWPPLPLAEDRQALVQAVIAGDLVIASHHRDVPKRLKALEVDRATPGTSTWPTMLGALREVFSVEVLQRALATGPRMILGLAGDESAVRVTADASSSSSSSSSSLSLPAPLLPSASTVVAARTRGGAPWPVS